MNNFPFKKMLFHSFALVALISGEINTVFPHIRPVGIIILHSHQMRVLLENTTFLLHKIVRIAGIIRGRAVYEEIPYFLP